MMKKYIKPEIVTLALESVDVIETSAVNDVYAALGVDETYQKQSVAQHIDDMTDTWNW